MKTADLTGALLDYFAGKAAGEEVYLWKHQRDHYPMCVRIVEGRAVGYSPSTDWAQGGPLLERYHIGLQELRGGWFAGHCRPPAPGVKDGRGDTPLIAIMRTITASKFGDTVPDEMSV